MNSHLSFFLQWKFFLAFQIILLFFSAMVFADSPKGGLAFLNGKVWTGDSERPWAEAVVVQGDRILFVGKNEDAKRWIEPSTRVIDLKGRLLLPGFNDAHVHFSDGGFSLIQLRLRDARNRKEFMDRIADYVKALPPNTWVTGGNWDHEAWPDKTYPDRRLVDSVTKSHPILVNRLDGHVALANSLALSIAGITKDTPDPEGGYIERDPKTGEPTGILKDTAMGLVSEHIPPFSPSVRMKAVQAAMQYAAELGVTSVQDMSPAADFHLYQELLREGKLTCRFLVVMPIETHTERMVKSGIEMHFGDAMLRIGSMKAFADGSMGAGSALFFDAYSDDPSTSGLGIYSMKKLESLVSDAHSKRLQIMTHAIGDKANRWVLDAYETAIEQYGQFGLRHRIEHAQVVTPEDLPRFAELGVIASIQPSHVIDDMRWAEKRIGKERCRNAYRCRSFFEAGAHVAFGTDWPVEDLNPMLGIYAATTREYPEGGPEGGWFPEEKISIELAVRSYTSGSAYAEFEEQNKGTVEAGKLADLIVLDRDLFSISPKEILRTKVDMTVVGGKVVFERK